MPSKLPWAKLKASLDASAKKVGQAQRTVQSLGNPNVAMTEVDKARGVAEGTPDPRIASKTPNEKALLDRVAWGRQMRNQVGAPLAMLSSAVMSGGYEALKAGAQHGVPGVVGREPFELLLRGSGNALGNMNQGDLMTMDPTTSDASFLNPIAQVYGASGIGDPKATGLGGVLNAYFTHPQQSDIRQAGKGSPQRR